MCSLLHNASYFENNTQKSDLSFSIGVRDLAVVAGSDDDGEMLLMVRKVFDVVLGIMVAAVVDDSV